MAIPAFTLARALHAGETVFTGWCSLPYPIVSETLACEGFPAVVLEAPTRAPGNWAHDAGSDPVWH